MFRRATISADLELSVSAAPRYPVIPSPRQQSLSFFTDIATFMFKVTFIDPLCHVHVRLQVQLRIRFYVHFRVCLLVVTFIKMMLTVPLHF
jgi:hypothetical protein